MRMSFQMQFLYAALLFPFCTVNIDVWLIALNKNYCFIVLSKSLHVKSLKWTLKWTSMDIPFLSQVFIPALFLRAPFLDFHHFLIYIFFQCFYRVVYRLLLCLCSSAIYSGSINENRVNYYIR